MVIGVPSSPLNMLSVANFDTPTGLDSWCGLSLPLARTQCRHQLRNGECVNSCCSTSASLGNTGTIPGLGGLRFGDTRSVLLEAHQHFGFAWSSLHPCRRTSCQPIHTTQHVRNSIRLPVNSLRIVPPVLRNVMILPLSHTCPTEMIDLCNPVFLGCNLKVTRHVDTVSRAQANCRVAGRRELMSRG